MGVLVFFVPFPSFRLPWGWLILVGSVVAVGVLAVYLDALDAPAGDE